MDMSQTLRRHYVGITPHLFWIIYYRNKDIAVTAKWLRTWDQWPGNLEFKPDSVAYSCVNNFWSPVFLTLQKRAEQ